MSFSIVANIYTTHTFPSREPEAVTLCVPAKISDEEAKELMEMGIGNNFALPEQLLDQVNMVNDIPDSDSHGMYGGLVLEQIVSLEIQDASEKTLAKFYVNDTHRDGAEKANHWRPLTEADEERVTVADWKRNNGRGIFVMSVDEFSREWGARIAFHDVVLTPSDKVVRLIGDSFCVIDPAAKMQPTSGVKPEAALKNG